MRQAINFLASSARDFYQKSQLSDQISKDIRSDLSCRTSMVDGNVDSRMRDGKGTNSDGVKKNSNGKDTGNHCGGTNICFNVLFFCLYSLVGFLLFC